MEYKMFYSTKTYSHSSGFSCAFRQWRADSHCNLVHGYALSFKFVFASETLDFRNWVQDFGGLKPLKQLLTDMFDHTTVVAEDDPEIEWFREGHARGTLRLIELPAVGCEMFAQRVFAVAQNWLIEAQTGTRVKLVSVEVSEHESNSAIYTEE
jgi:6-pyruvoyltetrahydropterin/6-carboxytetrahydropterin synthase